MKHLYVMISHTNTGFGRAIRFITGCYYNHSAIAFDEDLQQLYSFARKMYDIPLSAGLTQEHASMYTLGCRDVDVILYRIPVEDLDYTVARRTVQMMCRDGDYIYNLLSALTFPLVHGIPAYKACTCSEFTAGILRAAGFPLDRPDCAYHPKDFLEVLADYEIYRGSLLAYRTFDELGADPEFFRQHNLGEVLAASAHTLSRVVNRELLEHPSGPPRVTLPQPEQRPQPVSLPHRLIRLADHLRQKAM